MRVNDEEKVKLTVWLSRDLKNKLDLILKKKGYTSYAEYVRNCIRVDFEELNKRKEVIING